jgi:uridine kinase
MDPHALAVRSTMSYLSAHRRRLLRDVADRIVTGGGCSRVGVDGVDGVGKSTFAAELATAVRQAGREVVHLSADGFHRRRAERHRRGRHSAEGFWLDSYDYPALRSDLLDGFGPGGTGRYREAGHDLDSDQILDLPWRTCPADSVLILDGLFLHRAELAGWWDFSIFLRVPFAVSIARMAHRDGSDPDPDHPSNARYVGGQRLYFAACSPWERADLIVDNTVLGHPVIIGGQNG